MVNKSNFNFKISEDKKIYLYRLKHTLPTSTFGQIGITGNGYIFPPQTTKKLDKTYEPTVFYMILDIRQKGQGFLRDMK